MLKDILYIDIPIWKYIVNYLDIPNIINMVTSNPEIDRLTKNEYFWEYLCVIYKSIFFWELAIMRSEIPYIMLCDKKISRKQDFINIYKFDRLHKETKFVNELYYYMWIHLENGVNKENSYQMQTKLFRNYNLSTSEISIKYNQELFNDRQQLFGRVYQIN